MDFETIDFSDLGNKKDVFGETKTSPVDDRFYKLKRDEQGNGAAVLRFLPDPNMKLMQRIYRINANNQKGADRRWVSELSPQNINLPDPFHKRWAELWNAGKKDEARQFARSTRFFVNVMVVKDPATPENEGKIFLLDVSNSLKNIIEGFMFPSEADKALGAEPKPLFNPLEGHNFKLVSRKGANGFINYDSSSVVQEPSAIFNSKEEAIETIKNKCFDLDEFLKPEAYLSYEELERKLKYVMFEDEETSQASVSSTTKVENEVNDVDTTESLDDFLDNV